MDLLNTYLHHFKCKVHASLFIVGVVLLCIVAGAVTTYAQQAPHESAVMGQATGVIPSEYNRLFPIQWSGGSLYQLKANLATQGCIVNDVIVSAYDPYNGRTIYLYNQYNQGSASLQKQIFLRKYERFIPAGTLQVSCYNICDFRFFGDNTNQVGCLTLNQISEQITRLLSSIRAKMSNDQAYQQIESFVSGSSYIDLQGAQCNDDWHPVVKQKVFPTLPLPEDMCVIKDNTTLPSGSGFEGLFFIKRNDALNFLRMTNTYLDNHSIHYTREDMLGLFRNFTGSFNQGVFIPTNVQPSIYIQGPYNSSASATITMPKTLQDMNNIVLFHIEVHELCHANQYWQFISSLEPNQHLTYKFSDSGFNNFSSIYWISQLKLDEFNAIVGFNENGNLPVHSVYNTLGIRSPVELSAELCALYILDSIGQYPYYAYQLTSNGNARIGFFHELLTYKIRSDFDVNAYLTPQVREWIEKYMLGTRAI